LKRPSSVVVAAAQVPFLRGGAEWHARALVEELRARAFLAELVQLPFQWDPRRDVLRSALAWRLLDFSQANGTPIDLLIATRFPSYAARHPNKVVWLFHPFRQAYDLHDAGVDGFQDTPEERTLHQHVVELDTRLLKECRRLYTTSENNARRLLRYNGLTAEVLRLPLQDRPPWRAEGYGDSVLSVGRLEPLKRTELLVRAAAFLPESARVVVVGEGVERERLVALATELGVCARVEFKGFVSDEAVRDLYARAGAVFYAPFDEDYGLVTLEAFRSRRPVVTTKDAGGPLEFVRDGETGLVCDPAPEPLGHALTRLLHDKVLAQRLGEAGDAATRDIGWEHVIRVLTEG
jgi:glycosyltransferase involved in cell wall biosynthesis